jgi:glyoxylase-like metal-dependent hydrolase (beta-lactamase superfamily II)
MRRAIVLFVLVGAGFLPTAVPHAQADLTAVTIQKVAGNLYVVTGGRGSGGQSNTISGCTTVFVTDSGVVLVDTKLPGFANAILEQVKSVTAKPVTTIINTHTHNDHTGGNPEFPKTVEVVAHENTKTNMAKMDAFKGANAALLPRRTFTDRTSLLSGPDRIDLYYFGAGHTNGDAVIVFPALRVAVFGDLFARKWAPLVDANNGGSAVAYPQTLAKAIAGIRNVDTIITGHSTTTIGSGRGASFVRSGPVARWADLQEYAEFTRAFVAAAEAAMKAGKTVEEAVSGMRLPDKFKSYDMANAGADVQRVYEELKNR